MLKSNTIYIFKKLHAEHKYIYAVSAIAVDGQHSAKADGACSCQYFITAAAFIHSVKTASANTFPCDLDNVMRG